MILRDIERYFMVLVNIDIDIDIAIGAGTIENLKKLPVWLTTGANRGNKKLTTKKQQNAITTNIKTADKIIAAKAQVDIEEGGSLETWLVLSYPHLTLVLLLRSCYIRTALYLV